MSECKHKAGYYFNFDEVRGCTACMVDTMTVMSEELTEHSIALQQVGAERDTLKAENQRLKQELYTLWAYDEHDMSVILGGGE